MFLPHSGSPPFWLHQHIPADAQPWRALFANVCFRFPHCRVIRKLAHFRSLLSVRLSAPQQVTAVILPAWCLTLSFTHLHWEPVPSTLLCSAFTNINSLNTLKTLKLHKWLANRKTGLMKWALPACFWFCYDIMDISLIFLLLLFCIIIPL